MRKCQPIEDCLVEKKNTYTYLKKTVIMYLDNIIILETWATSNQKPSQSDTSMIY